MDASVGSLNLKSLRDETLGQINRSSPLAKEAKSGVIEDERVRGTEGSITSMKVDTAVQGRG